VKPAPVRDPWRARFAEEGLDEAGKGSGRAWRKSPLPQQKIDEIGTAKAFHADGPTHCRPDDGAKAGSPRRRLPRVWGRERLKNSTWSRFKLSPDPKVRGEKTDRVGSVLVIPRGDRV